MRPTASVLVLTASYGEGHNAAARAVAAACEAHGGEGSARVADIFALTSPRLNEVVRRGYLSAINRFPKVWSHAYRWMDHSALLRRGLNGVMLQRERARLAGLLAAGGDAPRILCSTYPAYSFMIERLRREGRHALPHYSVVTDSISINSLWWRAGCTGWLVPNEDSAETMRLAGVDPGKIHVTGFPVNNFFARHEGKLQPDDLGAGAPPRVLHIINSGTRDAEATAARLLAVPDWDLTFAVGRDVRLQDRLEKMAAGRRRPAQVLGWTDQIPRLLMTHHAVVSKAGGATTQEAIAARCPMIVCQVVPGQEEGNYELLRRHQIGARAETPESIRTALENAFANRGAVWRQWRSRLDRLARPNAAQAIAERLFAV
jgi:processive 1,2-diacylglycerol beta-glucosyltransferase